ncbi:MAG: ribonuclease P protein component [Nitrospirae bacterium]|nr:MAG: ribonuclease P protein component [Nitrospirota bacterium]
MRSKQGQRDPLIEPLYRKKDIDYVKEHGQRLSTPFFTMRAVWNPARDITRIGVVVGRRFGTAVARNRGKRIIRELVRQTKESFCQGIDLLIFPKRELLIAKHAIVWETWVQVLTKHGFLREGISLQELLCKRSSC